MRRIVYICWPATIMAGGIKMVFRHVEALAENGFAAVVATQDGKPPHWFASAAPMISLQEIVPDSDVLVLPENYAAMLQAFASWHNRKVVFCQSQHKALLGLAGRQDYADYGVQDIICPGQVMAAYCRRRFPTQNILVVPNYVDGNVFHPSAAKKPQIAFSPAKRPAEAEFIRDLFRSDNPNFCSIPWVTIAGMSEREVARILGESSLYLALARFDAFGLSTLEAMAAGCVVAGFTGFGGREYATARNGFWAAEDDCLECTDQLTLAARLSLEGGDRYRRMVDEAIGTARCYDHTQFLDRLTACWRSILTTV
jgi:glycosyltransferase involved in cell wall biosynthesis